MEAQSKTSSSLFRTPGIARTKMDAQVSYGVGFGCTCYGWKDNFKTLPMELVSGPNSSRVDRNRPRKLTYRICRSAVPPSFGPLGRVSFRRPLGVSPWYLHAPIFLYSVAAALVRVWVLLRFILSRTVVVVHRFVKPQLVRLIIHLQSHFN